MRTTLPFSGPLRTGRAPRPVRPLAGLVVAAGLLLAPTGCGGEDGTPSASAPPSPPTPASTASTPATGAPSRTATPPPAPAPPTTARPPAAGPTAGSAFPAALAGHDLERIPTSDRIVALTFDAGANADGLPSILATLARERVAGTFFLTGDFVTDFPDQASRIVAAGHRLGNHSIDHPQFTALTAAQISAQVLGAERTMRSVTAGNPAPLFRFPYGDRDARTISAVNASGYVAVRWTVDSLGWQGRMGGTRTASFVADRVLAAATPGEIALMHVGAHPTDHSTLDADALPAIIAGLRRGGYRFVTLDALLT